MPDYKQGKIYCIRSNETDEMYVGSTTLKLCTRMAQHKYEMKRANISSSIVLQHSSSYIELIELFPCDTKEQLNKREGEIIRSMNCVNKRIAGRTKEEYYKEDKKEYVKVHNEKIKEYQKQYRMTHKKYNPEYHRQYYLHKKNSKELPQTIH